MASLLVEDCGHPSGTTGRAVRSTAMLVEPGRVLPGIKRTCLGVVIGVPPPSLPSIRKDTRPGLRLCRRRDHDVSHDAAASYIIAWLKVGMICSHLHGRANTAATLALIASPMNATHRVVLV